MGARVLGGRLEGVCVGNEVVGVVVGSSVALDGRLVGEGEGMDLISPYRYTQALGNISSLALPTIRAWPLSDRSTLAYG